MKPRPARSLLNLTILMTLIAPDAAIAANVPNSPGCLREIARTETSLVKTLVHLKGLARATDETRCAAYQDHIETVAKAREVFARCKTGAERDTDIGQMDGAIDDARTTIARSCTVTR